MKLSNNSETMLRETNKKIVREYLRLMEAMDINAWTELWTENGVLEIPFPTQGLPNYVVGKTVLYKLCNQILDMFVSIEFSISNIQALEDPEWVLAEYTGEIPIKTGGYYNNRYCTLFHIRADKILLVREYFNPFILSSALSRSLCSHH